MKLLDIGCFNGDSVLHFISDPEITSIRAYDPNPDYVPIWRAIEGYYPEIKMIQAAVSNRTGRGTFNKRPKNEPLGSSLNKDKADFNRGEKLDVAVVDISEIVSESIWLKLDAEGEEYNILERLIETDKLRFIKKLFIEFHTSKLPLEYKQREEKIMEALQKADVEVVKW